jgi:hypothetical protein
MRTSKIKILSLILYVYENWRSTFKSKINYKCPRTINICTSKGYFTMSLNQKYLTYIQASRTVVRVTKYSQVRSFECATRMTELMNAYRISMVIYYGKLPAKNIMWYTNKSQEVCDKWLRFALALTVLKFFLGYTSSLCLPVLEHLYRKLSFLPLFL